MRIQTQRGLTHSKGGLCDGRAARVFEFQHIAVKNDTPIVTRGPSLAMLITGMTCPVLNRPDEIE